MESHQPPTDSLQITDHPWSSSPSSIKQPCNKRISGLGGELGLESVAYGNSSSHTTSLVGAVKYEGFLAVCGMCSYL